jgi:hypothetical protein
VSPKCPEVVCWQATERFMNEIIFAVEEAPEGGHSDGQGLI